MSVLAQNSDDHAAAAPKHGADARLLLQSHRYDGAAYLAGYVVECVIKAIVLHNQAYDPRTGKTDALKVTEWHRTLRSPQYGHKLPALLSILLSPSGARYVSYLPSASAAITTGWSEQLRYRPPGAITASDATSYVTDASRAEDAITQMTLDGVL